MKYKVNKHYAHNSIGPVMIGSTECGCFLHSNPGGKFAISQHDIVDPNQYGVLLILQTGPDTPLLDKRLFDSLHNKEVTNDIQRRLKPNKGLKSQVQPWLHLVNHTGADCIGWVYNAKYTPSNIKKLKDAVTEVLTEYYGLDFSSLQFASMSN